MSVKLITAILLAICTFLVLCRVAELKYSLLFSGAMFFFIMVGGFEWMKEDAKECSRLKRIEREWTARGRGWSRGMR